jgi:hypothetical protein
MFSTFKILTVTVPHREGVLPLAQCHAMMMKYHEISMKYLKSITFCLPCRTCLEFELA